jgi:hypothetical protein
VHALCVCALVCSIPCLLCAPVSFSALLYRGVHFSIVVSYSSPIYLAYRTQCCF